MVTKKSYYFYLYFNQIIKLIQSLKNIKKNSIFKIFIAKYIQKIIKDEISIVVNNSKFSIVSSKTSLNIIKNFSVLIICNKYAKNGSILQFLLRV